MHMEILNRHWENIMKGLQAEQMLEKLMDRKIFDSDDKDAMKRKTSPRAKSEMLLETLLQKIPDPFNHFVDILSIEAKELAFDLLKEGILIYFKMRKNSSKIKHWRGGTFCLTLSNRGGIVRYL